MIIFLHGAGKNDRDISNLADIQGEYAGLLPSLIETKTAPAVLMDNFVVLSPYAYGERSFYNEPRSKLLAFIAFALTRLPQVDPSRVFLFGFSDGATLSVELLTTRRFAGGIVCSYGFIGTLPDLALQRLSELPLWVFHSADDQIFRVTNSDNLVQSLRKHSSNCSNPLLMKYTRFDRDPESFAGPARGHTTGITASRDPAVYEWLLSLPPLR
jgi:predicted peptidase